jgi:hypothetical protein
VFSAVGSVAGVGSSSVHGARSSRWLARGGFRRGACSVHPSGRLRDEVRGVFILCVTSARWTAG